MMSNRKELEREYAERVTRYYEEHKKYEELQSQFVSLTQLESGKPIESPKRPLDIGAVEEIREEERRLDKLRQEMIEAEDRLYEAYH
jgi:hypothetical protein